MDLSRHPALALWVHGDGRGETLRIQFRDTAGQHADWLIPVEFTGWRLEVFPTAQAAGFDWRRTEYVLFYYNNLPANATCQVKLDGLKALAKLSERAPLRRPVLTVNGRRIPLPGELRAPDEALLLDSAGRCRVWRRGEPRGRQTAVAGGGLLLQPGENHLELTCDTSQGTPCDVSVRVVRLDGRGG